ncbi:hypothetical protein ALC56_04752, partial [Trachymyrmex septentrionalis]
TFIRRNRHGVIVAVAVVAAAVAVAVAAAAVAAAAAAIAARLSSLLFRAGDLERIADARCDNYNPHWPRNNRGKKLTPTLPSITLVRDLLACPFSRKLHPEEILLPPLPLQSAPLAVLSAAYITGRRAPSVDADDDGMNRYGWKFLEFPTVNGAVD